MNKVQLDEKQLSTAAAPEECLLLSLFAGLFSIWSVCQRIWNERAAVCGGGGDGGYNGSLCEAVIGRPVCFYEERGCVCVALPWVNIKRALELVSCSGFSSPVGIRRWRFAPLCCRLSFLEFGYCLFCCIFAWFEFTKNAYMLLWIRKRIKGCTALLQCFIRQRFSAILPSSGWRLNTFCIKKKHLCKSQTRLQSSF